MFEATRRISFHLVLQFRIESRCETWILFLCTYTFASLLCLRESRGLDFPKPYVRLKVVSALYTRHETKVTRSYRPQLKLNEPLRSQAVSLKLSRVLYLTPFLFVPHWAVASQSLALRSVLGCNFSKFSLICKARVDNPVAKFATSCKN
jgi:hypothetical protein